MWNEVRILQNEVSFRHSGTPITYDMLSMKYLLMRSC